MNDIDRLPNGNFQLSIRNFDTVLEVDPQTNEIVGKVSRPGDTSILNHQHNPHRLDNDTILVADSENDRVVEIDTHNGGTVTWAYDAGDTNRGLQCPRDVDRLPNGNTLISDSRNFRVLEINSSGEVVWQYSLHEERGIIYDADRLDLPEEPTGVPEHGNNAADINESQPITDQLATPRIVGRIRLSGVGPPPRTGRHTRRTARRNRTHVATPDRLAAR